VRPVAEQLKALITRFSYGFEKIETDRRTPSDLR